MRRRMTWHETEKWAENEAKLVYLRRSPSWIQDAPPPTSHTGERHAARPAWGGQEARGSRPEAELPCAVRGVARGWRGVVEGGAWRVARGTGSGRGVE
jgi:hypothetical protein